MLLKFTYLALLLLSRKICCLLEALARPELLVAAMLKPLAVKPLGAKLCHQIINTY
jgi:hypothetical protein